jgi:hypothetical protein
MPIYLKSRERKGKRGEDRYSKWGGGGGGKETIWEGVFNGRGEGGNVGKIPTGSLVAKQKEKKKLADFHSKLL